MLEVRPPSLPLAIGLALFAIAGQAFSDSPAPNVPAPTPSQLLNVPVTTILPGDVDLAPNIKNPVADDSAAAARGMKYFANFNLRFHVSNLVTQGFFFS